MKWQIYSIAEYPGDLWHDWDRLNKFHCNNHPMLQSRFIKLLVEYFPADVKVLTGYREHGLAALILLERSRIFIYRGYQPSQSQISLVLVPHDMNESEFPDKRDLHHFLYRLDLLTVDPLYQEGILAHSSQDIQKRATDIVVSIGNSFDQYWSERPKNLRKNVSRYINRINRKLGGYSTRLVEKNDDISTAVARYGFIESRGWKGFSGTSLHPGNIQGNFYRDLLECFATTGDAYIFELLINGKAVASRLCISNGQLLIILKTTFDEEFRDFAVSKILLYETLRYIHENRTAITVDFYTNASKEQLAWSTSSRILFKISYHFGVGGILLKSISRVSHANRRSASGEK